MSNKLYIVIDVQNDFVSGSLGSPWAVATTEKIAKFLESVKDDPETVGIWATRDTHCDENTKDPFFGINVSEFEVYEKTLEGQKLPVRHCIMNTEGWEIVPSVAKFVKADKIFNKPTFMSEWLGRIVLTHARANAVNLSQSIDEIVLMGFCTSICVISNALNLRGLMPNTKITVMEDLCADVSPESHIAACTVLRNCQIDVNVPTFAELDTRILELTSVRPSDEEIEKVVFGMLNSPKYNFRDERRIDKNSKFKEDCMFDSLDEVEFIMEIEEKFAISIPDEEAVEVKTVGDAIKLISSKKN